MRRPLRAFPIALLAVTLSASAAQAQIQIGGLNHYLCHKAKDSKFHPDKFPKDAGRDPASVKAIEMRDRLADDLFGGTAQLYDVGGYKGVCTPTTKEKIVTGGTAGDGNEFPVVESALNLVDFQVKQSKKDPNGNANPPGTAQKLPKGTRFRVVTQFYDEVVELKGPALALIGADEVGHGANIACTSEAQCDAIDPGLTCNPNTKTCLPADPLGGLPGTARSGPNFTCYQAKQVAVQPPVLVLAQNQLTEAVTQPDEPLLFAVSKMTRLCLPSDKEGENPGAEDSFDHLACYKVKQTTAYADPAKTKFSSALDAFLPGKPPKFGAGAVSVQTANFGERVLDVKGASEFCTPAFTSTVGDDDGIPACGDGDVYSTPGALFEECDDGNAVNGDGCSATCQFEEFCGDGIEQPGLGEECDDGGTVSGDGCSATCQDEFCGDGVEQAGLGEECDDGNAVNGDGCNASCEDEFCGDGIEQSGLGEECDDGGTANEDGCSATCQDEFCGDGVTQSGLDEECDGMDDLLCPGDCDSECQCTSGPMPPTAFRLTSVALADPPVFFAGSINILSTVNSLIEDAATTDDDPMDGFFDLSLITLFRPLLQGGPGGALDLGGARCTFPGPSTCNPSDPMDPLAGFTSADFVNVAAGVCLAHNPAVVGTNNNGTPGVTMNAPVAGADGCAVVESADITLNLLGLELPLQAVEVGVEYSGNPATGLLDGLLFGFLDETTAGTVILPADLPLVGGQPLTSLLRTNERDTGPGGVLGWWFHVNFTGSLATWTGP